MKSPNWQEARAFVDRIAGVTDPAMTFQVFDDKGESYELASWKHGKLTDPAVRKYLIAKANQGCGIYVVVSACDGKGRRRKNVTHARAVFIDLDGQPLPDKFEIEPDIINETSPGKYHVFWLIQDATDLNAFSDCQARLAAAYSADPRVFDPPRVVRLPGFYHQKKTPWRSRTLKICDADAADAFERRTLEQIADAHADVIYDAPSARAEGGRSDEPADGWDNEVDVAKAISYLKTVKMPKTGDRNNSGYRVAAKLNDFGISPELSFDLMLEHWVTRLEDPIADHEIRHVINSANTYKEGSAGSQSGASDFDEEIDADDLDAIVEKNRAKEVSDFDDQPSFEEIEDKPATSPEFSFEESPPKARPKTLRRDTGGMSWSYGNEIRAEALEWLWPHRIPKGKLTIIAGYPDNGKSQILLNLAACVSNGSSWPNDEGEAPKGVAIILSSEDDEADTLIPRLAAAGANLANTIIVRSMVTFIDEGKKRKRVLNIEDDLNKLTKVIKQVTESGRRVRMIGLDPINAYFGGSKKADSHKTADMRALLTPIAEWAANLKIAVVAISHFNKGGNAHTLYRVTDSGAITAAARAVYFALKVNKEYDKGDEVERVFVSGKHNLAADAIKGLTYRMGTEDVSEKTGVPNQVMPRIEFGGETDLTAEEAMDGIAKKQPGPRGHVREDAANWLAEYLKRKGGRARVKDIEADAVKAEIKKPTLARAMEDLGYGIERMGWGPGSYVEWFIPDAPAQDFEDERDADGASDDEPDFG